MNLTSQDVRDVYLTNLSKAFGELGEDDGFDTVLIEKKHNSVVGQGGQSGRQSNNSTATGNQESGSESPYSELSDHALKLSTGTQRETDNMEMALVVVVVAAEVEE
jgi:hypothetical protein